MLKTLISAAGEIRVAGRVPVSDILFDDPAKWAADGTLERLNGLARLWRGKGRPFVLLSWVALHVGTHVIDRRHPEAGRVEVRYRRDPTDAARWRRPGSVLSINRFMFYDHLCGDGGGGAIDLVAHARRCTRPEAIDFLAKLPRPVQPPKPPRREPLSPALKSRLVERRGLPDALVELCRDLGLIHADPRGNALFVRRNAAGETVGAEILPAATRRRPDRPADAARGGFWMSWDPDWPTAVILAASALDALSILALDLVPARRKGAVAVSCASSAAAALPEWIQEWNPQRIFCAYDATTRGDRAAKRLIRNDNRIVRLRPPLDGEGWNETLVRDRAGVPLETDDRRLA